MIQEPILQQIVNWAKRSDVIRTLFLIGSRAEKGEIDNLSDYDIAVFVSDLNPFIITSSWMKDIDELLLYQKSKFYYNEKEIETRLVLYKNCQRVDFSFWDNSILIDFIKNGLPDIFNIGYITLLDKDGFTKNLARPTYNGYIEEKPTQDFFLKRIFDFWFEVYCVAKYLKRKDFFYTIILRKELDTHILQMIIWYMQSKNEWSLKINSMGKKMQSWVDTEIWEELNSIYSHLDFKDGWRGLFEIVSLYKKLTKEVATKMSYFYPELVEQNIIEYIYNLKKSTP